MPIEWLTIATVLSPFLKDYAAHLTKSLAQESADGILGGLYSRFVPSEKLQLANESFVNRFSRELDSVIDLPTLSAASYQEALLLFLRNPSVQDALQRPLDGHSELDSGWMAGVWAELPAQDGNRLIELPEDFDWAGVAKKYHADVKRKAIANSQLRPVIVALATIRAADAAERGADAGERTAETVARLAGAARPFDLTRYADEIRKAYRHLQFGSLDADWTQYDRRMRLESVYVPQSVKQALPPRDLTRDYLQSLKDRKQEHGLSADEEETNRRKTEYEELSSRPLMETVDDAAHQRLVILGDPGLGKSTLLKHLALRWAEEPDRPPVLFIELRRVVRGNHESFLHYLEKGKATTCCLPQIELDQHLKDNETLVLFDGLDEVEEGERPDSVAAIIRFAGDYPRARVVVTTRIHGYYPGSTHPDQFRDAGFEQFTLQDFNEREIDKFINLWHQEAFQHDPTERDRFESRLRTALGDSPAIHELAANPLLLTMMAILSRNQDLPRDRGRLYERCAELLLKNWDLEKFPELKEKRTPRDLDIKDKLGPEQKMRILELVAAAMQQERRGLAGNLIGEETLKPIVEAELTKLGVPEPRVVASDLIWMLRDRNFMLAHLGDHQYAFVHRTFLEYFCARNLRYRLEKTSGFTVADLQSLFREHWHEDEWREVLRLVSGLIGAEHAGKCVSELLTLNAKADRPAAVFRAAECLREIREQGLIKDTRRDARQALLPIMQFDLPFYYEPWSPEAEQVNGIRSRAVQELARGWKDDPDTLPLLKDRAANDDDRVVRRAAVQELARAGQDDPDTLPWLKDRAVNDDDRVVRQAAVQELARAGQDDPDTLPLLKDRAVNDDDGNVRQAAVQELARAGQDDPDTLPLLKDRAVNDDHWSVRQAAVQELARAGKDDPDTLPLLKDRAVNDNDEDVRQAAVQELARSWKDDPDTLPLLKDRAVNDDHWSVRQAAVHELARSWKDDPDTLPLLKDRAANDDNGSVRQAAVQELARAGKDDPDTLPWLKDRAANDDHGSVRQAAVQELARAGKDDLDTLPWLKDRAANDDNWSVRRAAVQELARGWKDDPDTLPLLKDRAANDDNWSVRWAAVQELARGWKDDPDTLPLLKDRAANDDDEDVRQAAVQELARAWKDDPDVKAFLGNLEG